MKKIIVLVSLVFVSSAMAAEVSLEELYKSQTVVTIKPINYNGLPVLTNLDAITPGPLNICLSVGYSRVVPYEEADTSANQREAYILKSRIMQKRDISNESYKIMTSVTCGK